MNMKTVLSILAGVAAQLASAADPTASTPSVSVSYMGSSGGMKLFGTTDSTSFLMIQQSKLEEVTPDGKATKNKFNVAGRNSWSSLVANQTASGTDYTTTFTKTNSGITFNLLTHFSTENIVTTDAVPCTGCQAGEGGEPEGMCQDEEGFCSNVCDANFTACTETVTTTKNQLKFSVMVEGWQFLATENKLLYSISIKSKGGDNETATEKPSSGSMKGFVVGDGFINTPTVDKLVGGTLSAPAERDVVVTTNTDGEKTTIDFEFKSFGAGETLYYDPDVGLNKFSGTSGAGYALPSAMLVAFFAAFNALAQ